MCVCVGRVIGLRWAKAYISAFVWNACLDFWLVLPGSSWLHDLRSVKGSRLLPPPFDSLPNPHYQMYDVLSLQHNDAQFTSHTFTQTHIQAFPFIFRIIIHTVLFYHVNMLPCFSPQIQCLTAVFL